MRPVCAKMDSEAKLASFLNVTMTAPIMESATLQLDSALVTKDSHQWIAPRLIVQATALEMVFVTLKPLPALVMSNIQELTARTSNAPISAARMANVSMALAGAILGSVVMIAL